MTSTERLTADQVDRAAALIVAGGVVAFPTETVYGLGADATNRAAVDAIYRAKGRPAGHPLIVHVGSSDAAWSWTRPLDGADVVDPRAVALAEQFWPGPLTLILPRSNKAASVTVGGLDSIGLRVPAHPLARALIDAVDAATGGEGAGLAGPSANRFGHVSPTSADHVLDDLDGRIDAVLDGGSSAVGVESTIVELVDERTTLLRPGGVTIDEIRVALDNAGLPGDVVDGRSGPARAAGMLASHYAPDAGVVVVRSIDEIELTASDAVIAPVPIDHRPAMSLGLDADDFAAGLYAALRSLDRLPTVERIVVVAPADGRMLDAVLDRLTKAAAPRSDP